MHWIGDRVGFIAGLHNNDMKNPTSPRNETPTVHSYV